MVGDHGVIRAWFFQPLATTAGTGARDWTRFDRTLAAARVAGYLVIPTLGNQWGECGHKGPTAGYKSQAWYETGYTQLQPEDSVAYATYKSYRDWVAEMVARYKDDPTIMAWQLMNEAEVSPVLSRMRARAGPARFDALRDRAEHVVRPGEVHRPGPPRQPRHDRQRAVRRQRAEITRRSTRSDTIDLCEFHDYDPWAPMPGDQWNGLALRIQQCDELGKPLFIGEVGLRPADVGGSFESRVASLRAKLIAQRGAGIDGHLVWNWGPGLPGLDTYDIGPGDPLLTLLASGPTFADPATPYDADWVAPTIDLWSPSRSLYTQGEPLTADFACQEVGSSGLATCVGTVADGGTIDTTTPGHFTFTVTTTDNVGNHRSVSRGYDVTAGDVATTVPPGPATVTTDPGGYGATATTPIQTSLQFVAPAGDATTVAIDSPCTDRRCPGWIRDPRQ